MNQQELLELIDIDETAAMRILRAHKIKVQDILYSNFNKQEVANRLCDYSDFEQCLNHVLNYENNDKFQFIYKYFDRDFTYNCLQMEVCFSCYMRSERMEEIRLPTQRGPRSKQVTYQLGKKYRITGIQLEAREEILNRIKIILHGDEAIPYSAEFKPPLIAQQITVEYPIQDFDKICLCSTKESYDCPKCTNKILQITFIGSPLIDIGPIQSEEEVEQINNIVSELESQKQINQHKLRDLNNALQQYRFQMQIVQQMKDAYKEFNQAAVLSEMYNRRINQFYKGQKTEKQQCVFSNCVECSRRVLQNAVGISEDLLRKLYFSDNLTHKEKNTAIRLLDPSITYRVEDLEQISKDPTQYKELCLQAKLNLKGSNNIQFIKEYLDKCIELQLNEIIIAMLKTLIISPIDALYQLLTTMKIENICLEGNVVSQLFLISNIEVQESLQELIINTCKNDEFLGLNILLNGLEFSNDQKFYQIFDEIQVKVAGDAVVDFLVNYITDHYIEMEQQKLLKCFQMIQKCWPILTTDQLKWYIELDKLYNKLGQYNPRINEIYNQLYQNMQINDNFQLVQYLILQLLQLNQNYQQISRLSQMIHNLLYKKMEFRIKVQPTRGLQHYAAREKEYSSLNFETLEDIRQRALTDLFANDENLRIDLVILDTMVNDTSLSLEVVYKYFYIPEKARLINQSQKILTMNAQQEQQMLRQQQKSKEFIQLKQLMEINYIIQGVITNPENYQDMPNLVDQQKQKLEQQIIEIIEPEHFKILFTIVNNFLKEGKRFMNTVQKIINIMRFICNKSSHIKSMIINCNGIVVLIKIYLQEPNENEKLLDFINDLLLQTNQSQRRFSENIDAYELEFHDSENLQLINQVLKHLEQFSGKKKIASTLCQIIPRVVRDLNEPIKALIAYFKQNVRFEWNNEPLGHFAAILHHTPKYYTKLRDATKQSGIYQQAVQCYLTNQFTEEYTETNANCLCIILSVAIGSRECQNSLIEQGLIQQIFQLAHNHNEGMKELQRVCDSYINFVKDDYGQYISEDLKQLVQKLVAQKQAQIGENCKNKRMQKMMKFSKNPFASQILQLPEEKGLQCMACKEGYSLSPNLLGIYVYSLQYKIPEEQALLSMQIQEIVGIQSVTYFTVIHQQCHRNSVECAIKSYKEEQPRSPEELEWECAIKTNGCKCNNFLPLKNGNGYDEALEIYFRRSERIMKDKINSKCWILLNDLKGLILRMARQDNLSSDAGAGTYEHNLKLIPIMMSAIICYNVTQYTHLMSLQQTSLEYLSIALVVSLFHPYQDWQHYKVIYKKEAKEYLVKAIDIIDIIMENILKYVPMDSNYQKSLDTYLNHDQKLITSLFEKQTVQVSKNENY